MRRMLKTLRERWLPTGKFSYLPYKQRGEIDFWEKFIDRVILWHQGKLPELYGRPSPDESIKVKTFNLKENAIRTWIKVASQRYLNALKVEPDYFRGCKVLDVGCGPIPNLHCFHDITPFGLDQLIAEYKEIGFPLDSYQPPVIYTKGSAEHIPFEDHFFDAVISVNAIDHVDDFGQAAREIRRVLKPAGKLRMQVHYHAPTRCEPWKLDDTMLLEAFQDIGIRKICETEIAGPKREKLVVWSTPD